jgi:UDP-glucose 4-epimerase
MKILITGGSGFIGRNLLEQFRERHEVAAPKRDELNLLDDAAVRAYLESHRFDAIIHAASGGVSRMHAPGPTLLADNCRMFFNLARNSHAFGRMLFLSSGSVYDRAHWQSRMAEDYFDAHVPSDDYSFSKYICAKAIEGMSRVYDMRVFGVFGPHEDWRVRFVSNACCRALWGLPIVIRQNVSHDYLDVEDLGRILEWSLLKSLRYRQYNVCRGLTVELRTLAEKIAAISGANLQISVVSEGPALEYSGDNSRLLAEFPEYRFREIDDSLARLYRWYAERKDSIDASLLRFDG